MMRICDSGHRIDAHRVHVCCALRTFVPLGAVNGRKPPNVTKYDGTENVIRAKSYEAAEAFGPNVSEQIQKMTQGDK